MFLKNILLRTSIAVLGFSLLTIVDVRVRAEKSNPETLNKMWVSVNGEDWSLACVPMADQQNDALVYSVTSELGEDVRIIKVGLQNRSGRSIAKISLGWWLYDSSHPSRELLSGESKMLTVPLAAGKRLRATYPLVSLSELNQSLFKNRRLTGDFRIEVAVKQISYDDGFSIAPKRALEFQNLSVQTVGYRLANTAGIAMQDCGDCVPIEEEPGEPGSVCANKVCKLVPRKGGWSCSEPLTGYNCKVSGNNCTDSKCPGNIAFAN